MGLAEQSAMQLKNNREKLMGTLGFDLVRGLRPLGQSSDFLCLGIIMSNMQMRSGVRNKLLIEGRETPL